MSGAARAIPLARHDGGIDASERLIVALDVPGLEQARAVVDELGDAVKFYKVGPHLFEDGLVNFIERRLIGAGKHAFLDFKSVDIGDTMRGMASKVSRLGVDFLTVMGTTATIRAAKEGLEGATKPKILVVTVLTDHDEADIRREYGKDKTLKQLVIDRAPMAAAAGADGVICSPNEVADVKHAVRGHPDPFLIVTPGVRPIGSPADGQKRVATPAEAIRAGADYLVVGRPITKQRPFKRRQAALDIIEEMQEALNPSRIRAVS